ncbi:hypothetical protein K439DRAFT_1417934 [Ramaria rubella]|nr:hypothetical protein K439DRAFT_1417934 [Ramaria rubella]
MSKNKLSRLYDYLLNTSILTRWFVFITPVLGLLWIPGILGLTAFPATQIWGVKLIWWSIWFSVAWGGWWGTLAFALTLPPIARYTVGVVAVKSRRYIDWLGALPRYIALFLWTLVSWVAWQPLINSRQSADSSPASHKAISLIAKLLFGFFLCAAVLLGEKFAIQFIAGKFHERSYAERIADQKKATKILVTLYQHSSDVSGRSDTLDAEHKTKATMHGIGPGIFKKAFKGVRGVAETTTTAFGNLAREIAGSSILLPNSPQAMVAVALGSANKTRLLARRLFYSFVQPGKDVLLPHDISKFFPTQHEADDAFMLFDKDGNGDATRDEMEMVCGLDCHREQLSIANSMRDLDSAVGRLDNIFMSLYSIVAIIIIAVVLDSELTTLLAGAGTLILGLSWLIGGSLAEVLTSIIFLFIKHPFDVGDRVTIETEAYTVKEIRLLSTMFLDKNNTLVQAPNSILSTKYISNIRRSPTMSETFAFDVAFDTTFEQIEALRDKMLAFVTAQRRDYLPSFDVVVVDIPDQEKMSLTADIKYKSNWQQGALKVKRRNKWVCTLKQSMAELGIYGPSGNPETTAEPKRYTQVPWEEVKKLRDEKEHHQARPQPGTTSGSYRLADHDAVIFDSSQDVFGEAEQLGMLTPQATMSHSHDNTQLTMGLYRESIDEIEMGVTSEPR